jgi:hypothetical protein
MCSIVIVFDAAYYYCEVCILLEGFVIISVLKVVSYPNTIISALKVLLRSIIIDLIRLL